MFSKLIAYLRLPAEVSTFEQSYLRKVNRLTAWFFFLHIPVFGLIALVNGTGLVSALVLTSAVAAGPIAANRVLSNPRTVTLVYGFAAMLMGGLLVHFGQGPVQIEMHFYFFAVLAMLALYGNPAAILVAAATVTVHHLLLWVYLPESVFNYDAPWWVVMVHAAFVVLESAAAIFIARSFFDNVIGLEKIVQERTAALDQSNRAMHLVLDNIDQALLSLDGDGRIRGEYSAATVRWFGRPAEGASFWEFMSGTDEDFGFGFELAWEQCVDGFMPLDVCIAQAPKTLELDGSVFAFKYQPLLDSHADDGKLVGMLVVVSDTTAEVKRQRLEREQRDVAALVDRLVRDRAGVAEFLREANGLVAKIVAGEEDATSLKRTLHTLKGNSLVYGLQTIGQLAHTLETQLVEEQALVAGDVQQLASQWERLQQRLASLLGEQANNGSIEVTGDSYRHLLRATLDRRSYETLAALVVDLRTEPSAIRLERVGVQAKELARRLNKEGLEVEIDAADLRMLPGRLSSFWSAFVHVIRNAIDHGIEGREERTLVGKGEHGRLTLRTSADAEHFIVEVRDDGRGIDWEAVRRAAQTRGIPSETSEELTEALFAPGLSTAHGVSDYSGRGVGMTALREACQEHGGLISVRSELGKGTSIKFSFPLQATAVSARELLLEEAA